MVAIYRPAVAGYLIAGGLDMSTNFLVFAAPIAVSAEFAYRFNIR